MLVSCVLEQLASCWHGLHELRLLVGLVTTHGIGIHLGLRESLVGIVGAYLLLTKSTLSA